MNPSPRSGRSRSARFGRLAAVAALFAAPAPGAAQPALPPPLADAPAPSPGAADSLWTALDAFASLHAAEERVAADPGDYGAAWRAARAAVALGVMATEEEEQNGWYARAVEHAARAVALDSLGMDALYWLAAAKGRLALQQGPRTTADLAQQVMDLAHRLLALDPGHAGAHNILGNLNYEVMTLSRFERFLARTLLGNEALRSSSWEGAERHLALAVAAAPDVVAFRLDLARTHARRGRPAEAAAELRAALELPARTPPDPMWQRDAGRRLVHLEEAP